MALTAPKLRLSPSASQKGLSLASRQALAILAVDDIRPSSAGVALMQSIDSGAITRTQAIQSVIERARLYANRLT